MADHFQRSRQLDPIILSRRRKMLALSLAALTIVALPAQAQTEPKPFSPEELDQMLAPIALYDDALLSQVLMAASYPLEIVEAARWSKANPNLKGDAAVTAVADKTWDVSVKSLVAFPSVLAATQRASRLDPEAWRCADRSTGRRRRLDPAAARQGCRGRHPEDRQGTDRHDPDAGQRHHHCDSADRSAGRVRAHLRPEHGLWAVVQSELSPNLLSHGWRPDERPCLGRGHCCGGCDVQ